METLATSFSTFPSFVAYFAGGCSLTAIFGLIYSRLTPHREIQLIRAGNNAAAIAFAGGLLGFTIPVASVIAHSAHLLDLMVWGAVAMIVQLGGFLVARWILPGLSKAIENGVVSDAVFLAALSIALGILDAACMAG